MAYRVRIRLLAIDPRLLAIPLERPVQRLLTNGEQEVIFRQVPRCDVLAHFRDQFGLQCGDRRLAALQTLDMQRTIAIERRGDDVQTLPDTKAAAIRQADDETITFPAFGLGDVGQLDGGYDL